MLGGVFVGENIIDGKVAVGYREVEKVAESSIPPAPLARLPPLPLSPLRLTGMRVRDNHHHHLSAKTVFMDSGVVGDGVGGRSIEGLSLESCWQDTRISL